MLFIFKQPNISIKKNTLLIQLIYRGYYHSFVYNKKTCLIIHPILHSLKDLLPEFFSVDNIITLCFGIKNFEN